MAARASGSGNISFGLVSIPFKQYTAASSQNVRFNMLHKKTGNRVKQQYIDPVTEEIVPRSEMVKGYEHAKDVYVQFSEEELKSLEAERNDRLDIVEFVPEKTVDFLYIENTYYLGPDKGGDRAYRLLSESMARMGRIAVGRYWSRGKEQLVLLRPYKGGLLMHQVYYADEVRSFDDVERPGTFEFKDVEEELADKLIEQLSTDAFMPEQYHDEYRDRVLAAVEQKVAGQEVTVSADKPQAQIIDLFEALKRSLKPDEGAAESGDSEESEAKPIKKAGPRKSRAKKTSTG